MSWVVHKFGGASVKDADAVRNLGIILMDRSEKENVGLDASVVVSAMGKTTNALEEVWQALPHAVDVESVIAPVLEAHQGTVEALGLPGGLLDADFAAFRVMAESWRGRPVSDEGYDSLVGQGERWSTRIVAAHLGAMHLPAIWVSAWDLVHTDGSHRAARVDVGAVRQSVQERSKEWTGRIPVMQGFVGSGPEGQPTTLGREGSDFSGALIAEALGAERFIVWKDVPGVMTGDPRFWPHAECLPALDHGTADILGKAGAGVLHRDTVAPIRRAGIPLHVRSFLDPEAPGTRIEGETPPPGLPPLWTLSVPQDGERQIRCIGADAEEVAGVWGRHFPEVAIRSIGPDPQFPRCTLLLVDDWDNENAGPGAGVPNGFV